MPFKHESILCNNKALSLWSTYYKMVLPWYFCQGFKREEV